MPVRNQRLRPWPTMAEAYPRDWWGSVPSPVRKTYRTGVEGLPQPLGREFGSRWARYCGASHGILMAHGTDALRLALAAAFDHDGLEYGGEVIVPNFSFIASATAPLDRRFGVVLVDVDPRTLLLDPNRIEEAIIPGRTRAILPVHLFGQPADMTAIKAIADRHRLLVIEDAAQAHGAEWESGRVGSLGDAGVFSFQSSKNLSCGEGGALVTSDPRIFERAHALHNVGRSLAGPERWVHRTLGWNCRATEYQAGLLLHRLSYFDALQARRRANFERLTELLSGGGCIEPIGVHEGVRAHGMYMFAMRYRAERCGGIGVDEFLECVRLEGIPIFRAFQAPLSEQPAMRDLLHRRPSYVRCLDTPVAAEAARNTLFIPHEILLARRTEMEDISDGIGKVERYHA